MTLTPRRTFAISAISTLLLASCAVAQGVATEQTPYGGDVVMSIIARVNDQIITSSDYDRAMKEMEQEDEQRGATMQQESQDRKNLLRSLIDQQLWLSKGKELGTKCDVELTKRLDDIRKQYHLASIEDLQKAAQEQGVSFEDFKSNICNQIITQNVMRQEVGSTIQITPGETRQYYEQHKQDYTRPESIHLDEILISTGSDGTDDPQKLAAAKAKAEDIESKLHAGGDFSQLARNFSDGPTAAGGGDLGDYKRGQLPQELEDKTFSLKPGEWTDPILTRQGWIILKVTQHTAAGPATYQDVQDQVADALYMSRMEPAIRAYLNKMRDSASIFIAPGYNDTGATPNEISSNITFSTYTPPAPKKKARVERTRFRETGRSARNNSSEKEAVQAATPPVNTSGKQSKKKHNKKEEATVEKPGKKEKIRFGQKPRETLPSASTDASSNSTIENAGAVPDIANADQEPVNPLDAQPAARKMRFSDRARVHKTKKQQESPQESEFNAAPPTAAEVADRQVQASSLGMGGNSKKKKKQTTKTQKQRYSQTKKPEGPAPVFTPAPPVQGAPAPAGAPQQQPSSSTNAPQSQQQ
ncbi:MAG TPA: peptidylprolyl isomerase [Terracidiphilus sp.]|nr:peptidylprolyl isomerase [Terracidiphilus sp.]